MAQVTDAELLQGHPGNAPAPAHGAPAPDDSRATQGRATVPSTTKVVLGNVEYDVPVDLATALRRERDRLAGEFGSRVQQYERRLAAVESRDDDEPETVGLQPPDHRLLDATSEQYNPERYHRENLQYQHALVQSGIEAVEARRREEQDRDRAVNARQADWDRQVNQFYATNPELRGNEDVVDAVWRNNFPALKDLPTAEGFAELARLSKTRIVQLTETGKAFRGRRQPTLETSGGTAVARASRREPTEDESNEPVRGGISDAIRAKSRRFRNPHLRTEAAA